jgi:hypothetical protein
MAMRRCSPLALSFLLFACPQNSQSVSEGDAQVALEQSALSTQADTLVSDTVELSTNFSIGQSLENAAEQLKDYVQSQLPCADITRDHSTLSITYGAKSGNCSYHGHSVTGEHTIQVMRNADNEVSVHHVWNDLSDGHLSISGDADVTWSRTAKSRHVLHELTYRVLSGRDAGRTGTGRGDRTQTAIDGGVRLEGERTWDGDQGHFALDIDGVEMRFVDPVPEAGTYSLTTPSGAALTLVFSRRDADSIRVQVNTAQRSFAFVVTSSGAIER